MENNDENKATKKPLVFWLKMLGIASVAAFVWFLYRGFAFGWPDWTGFNEQIPPPGVGDAYQHSKKLWDWLELLIVPLVLAAGAFYLNRTERIAAEKATEQRAKTEQKIAEQRTRDDVLEAYLDKMAELLVDKNLLRSKPDEEVREIARIRTLTAMRRLDSTYNKILLQFLRDAKLIGNGESDVIDFENADLQGINLYEANLSRVNLRGANLREADLTETLLEGTDLREANMIGADFNNAYLKDVKLQGAYINETWLETMEFDEVNTDGVYLYWSLEEGGIPTGKYGDFFGPGSRGQMIAQKSGLSGTYLKRDTSTKISSGKTDQVNTSE